jgi:hypothetical protein
MIDLETQRTYDLKDIILTELHKQLDWKIKQRLYKLPYKIMFSDFYFHINDSLYGLMRKSAKKLGDNNVAKQ